MESEKPSLNNEVLVANADNSKDVDDNIPLVYVEPICNQDYECIPYNVVKLEELNLVSSGFRGKKDQFDSETKCQQVPLADGTESSPLPASAQPEIIELKMRKCEKKLAILFGLVLCLSLVAVALGLINLLNEQSDGGMGLFMGVGDQSQSQLGGGGLGY